MERATESSNNSPTPWLVPSPPEAVVPHSALPKATQDEAGVCPHSGGDKQRTHPTILEPLFIWVMGKAGLAGWGREEIML